MQDAQVTKSLLRSLFFSIFEWPLKTGFIVDIHGYRYFDLAMHLLLTCVYLSTQATDTIQAISGVSFFLEDHTKMSMCNTYDNNNN